MKFKQINQLGQKALISFLHQVFLGHFALFIFLYLSYLPFGLGQCDPPQITGVPENMVVESQTLQTTEVTYFLADGGSIETSSELTTYDYVAMAPQTEVEQITLGYNDIDDHIYIREVMNAEEYFPPYVLPYSHTVQYGGVSTFFQGDQPIHTVIVDSSFINGDVNNMDDGGAGEGDLPSDGEFDDGFVPNEYGQLIAVGEDYEITIDTLANTITTVEFDSLGVWQYRVFEQFPMNESNFNLPVYVLAIERHETVDGLCAFKVVEEHISDLCAEQTVQPRSTVADENEKVFDLQIYPNPVRNNLNIVPSIKPSETASLQIFDVSGRQVETRNGFSVKNLIEMEAYPPGLYFVRYSDQNQVITKKFVKQ